MPDLTPQQLAFIATAAESGSVALDARAGTGKTFSLRQWANSTRKGGIATSFSRSTVSELTNKMPSRFQSKTLHGLGFQAIKQSGNFQTLDKDKIYNLVKAFCADNDYDYELQAPVRQLLGLARSFGLQPDRNGPEGLIADEHENWEELADLYEIDMTAEVLAITREVLQISNQLALKQGIIDFDDMLYIALLWPHRFPRVPIILADEIQDFSALQHKMVKKCLLPGGRVIGAGDDRQAIYAFRGALTDSYAAMVQTFSMQRLPLTVSFRCPKAVILEAQRYVPDIEAAPSALEGSVVYPQKLELDEVPSTVLCRNNAPLIRLALSLLVSGRTVEVAGQDIGRGLINLTTRITKKKSMPTDQFLGRLKSWRDREVERHPKRKARIMDKFLALRALSGHHKDLSEVRAHLGKLYPNPNSKDYRPAQVQFTTIHRAKGLEWPRVLFLDPQLLPSKYAKQPHELLQEDNLAYVGITRAQEELVYCSSDNIVGLEQEDDC